MAIFRGEGGSVEGITEADILLIAISQGGTGASTAAEARTNLGLGAAATTDSSDYATAAQGALADTATQPEDLGTAAAEDIEYFATAAQGTLADSAVQPGDLATVATSGSYNDLTDLPTAGSGTVTSVAMSVPTGLSVSGSPVTTTGTLAVTYTSGYAIPTTAKQTEWDTAYGWGNHASAGYAADSGVVHTTGTETIAGAKTFSTSVASPTITASTKFVSSYFDASGSGGGALRNASGTPQLQWGGGGGNNITFDVAANLNPANSQIDISPTGTGTVRINPATLSSMDNVTIGGTTAAAITGTTITATTYAGGNTGNWNTAYGWGNHASAGYLTSETYTGTVTSVAMSVPTGLTVSGSPITGSGTLAVTFTAGYSIPTTTNQTNWSTAYGWGNHASAGYLTSSSTLDASKLSGTIDGGTY